MEQERKVSRVPAFTSLQAEMMRWQFPSGRCSFLRFFSV